MKAELLGLGVAAGGLALLVYAALRHARLEETRRRIRESAWAADSRRLIDRFPEEDHHFR